MTPLKPKQLPADVPQVKAFLCTNCRCITCTTRNPDGSICGREMRKAAQKRLSSSNRNPYTCGKCPTVAESTRVLAASHKRGWSFPAYFFAVGHENLGLARFACFLLHLLVEEAAITNSSKLFISCAVGERRFQNFPRLLLGMPCFSLCRMGTNP